MKNSKMIEKKSFFRYLFNYVGTKIWSFHPFATVSALYMKINLKRVNFSSNDVVAIVKRNTER